MQARPADRAKIELQFSGVWWQVMDARRFGEGASARLESAWGEHIQDKRRERTRHAPITRIAAKVGGLPVEWELTT